MHRVFKISLVCFFLFDYYFEIGGRLLDYVGLLFLALYIFQTYSLRTPIVSFYRVRPFYKLNAFFWIVFGLIGIMKGGLVTVGAYFVGAFFVFPVFYNWGLKSERAVKQIIHFLIILNLIFFFLQYFVYKGTGFVINFHAMPGLTQPRVYNEDIAFFRAAGLYQEPSQYTLSMIMLVTLWAFISKKPFGILSVIVLFTVLLSESLWGIGAMVVYILLFSKSKFFKISFIAGMSLLIFIIVLNPLVLSGVISGVTLYRIANFNDDASTGLRLGVNLEGDSPSSLMKLIGTGLKIDNFQSSGSNGLNFYVTSFGYFGFLLWIVSFFRSIKRKSFIVLVTVGFIMTSYPIFTYQVWWAWLALVFAILNNDEVWT